MRRSLVLAGLAAIVLGACASTGSVTGGGAIQSYAGGTAKATFGFNLTCDATSGFVVGLWVYHDKGVSPSVDIGGKLTTGNGVPCNPAGAAGGSVGNMPVPYAPLNARVCHSGCAGTAFLYGNDLATSGITGDTFGIHLSGGWFSGYGNGSPTKPLLAGNLVISGTVVTGCC